MGWQDRDWARLDDEERRRLYGAGPRRSQTPLLERDVDVRRLLLALAAVAAAGIVAWHPFRSREAHVTVRPVSPLSAVVLDTVAPTGGTRTWPGGVVRFANEASDQEWAVRQAAAAWNRSGARVELLESPPADADVVIRDLPVSSGCTHADATVGDVPDAYVEIFARDDTQASCTAYSAALALTHEFGHVLGLGHTTGECATMNPVGSLRGPAECPQVEPWEWHCRLLEPGDVQRAVALYGGAGRDLGDAGCPLYGAVPAPMSLQAAQASDGSVLAAFSRPPDPPLPAFLAAGAGEDTFSESLTAGACLGRPAGTRYLWDGAVERIQLARPAPGRYCLEVWAYDGLGRPSSLAASRIVDVSG
ncbi:MAG TPA: matrixin family metalloprotease [Gaiellaceae bacterium]|nr:matrixin family metalloprotease [Gaiellaceae bacterium]